MNNRFYTVKCLVGLAALLIFSVACSPERKVEGQVFVVTQSRENVKMGLVGIYVVPPEQISAILSELGAQHQKADLAWRTQTAQLKANLKLTNDSAGKFLSAMTSDLTNDVSQLLTREAIDKTKAIEKEIYSRPDFDQAELNSLLVEILTRLSKPATKTDADGRFALRARPGDWFVAYSQRKIGGSEEDYFWALPVPVEKQQILISNDCLWEGSTGFESLYKKICGKALEQLRVPPITADQTTTEWADSATSKLNASIELLRAEKEKADAEAKAAAKAAEEKAAADKKAFDAWQAEIKQIEDKRAADEARYAAERVAEQAKKEAEQERIRIENSMPRPGKIWNIPVINLEILPVLPGRFVMGNTQGGIGSSNEKPLTEVTLTKPYWLGKAAVTQSQYEGVMGKNPSQFKGSELPVEQVSWTDAMDFCRLLNEREKAGGRLPEGYVYSLPTEAQRDFACRAGITEQAKSVLDDIAWYGKLMGSTHPVAQKKPNAWGFYDMQGNVYEWCSDWFGDYPGGSVVDPVGPASGSAHVARGGAWNVPATFCRISFRYSYKPTVTQFNLGFRIALIPSK